MKPWSTDLWPLIWPPKSTAKSDEHYQSRWYLFDLSEHLSRWWWAVWWWKPVFYKLSDPISVNFSHRLFCTSCRCKQNVTESRSLQGYGGTGIPGIAHLIKQEFRYDKMNLSDNFCSRKCWFSNVQSNFGAKPDRTFIFVNGQLRQDNLKTIQSMSKRWTQTTLAGYISQMKMPLRWLFWWCENLSVPGKAIGESVHEGVDLASTEHALLRRLTMELLFLPDPWVYTQCCYDWPWIRPFFTLRSQSIINVKMASRSKRGCDWKFRISGLAGGTICTSLYCGQPFVNPQEWWDPHWMPTTLPKKLLWQTEWFKILLWWWHCAEYFNFCWCPWPMLTTKFLLVKYATAHWHDNRPVSPACASRAMLNWLPLFFIQRNENSSVQTIFV